MRGATPSGPSTIRPPPWISSHGLETPRTRPATTRETHYGNQNCIFRNQGNAHLPRRSFSPMPPYFDPDLPVLTKMRVREPRVSGYVAMMQELSKVPVCAENVDPKALPDNCFEVAPRPQCCARTLDDLRFRPLSVPP